MSKSVTVTCVACWTTDKCSNKPFGCNKPPSGSTVVCIIIWCVASKSELSCGGLFACVWAVASLCGPSCALFPVPVASDTHNWSIDEWNVADLRPTQNVPMTSTDTNNTFPACVSIYDPNEHRCCWRRLRIHSVLRSPFALPWNKKTTTLKTHSTPSRHWFFALTHSVPQTPQSFLNQSAEIKYIDNSVIIGWDS